MPPDTPFVTQLRRTAVADTSSTLPTDDLSALAWVHSELRRSLDNAHKSLRRYLNTLK